MQTNRKLELRPDWLMLLLLVVPAAIVLAKLSLFPASALFTQIFTLEDLPSLQLRKLVENILFVPLGALVVVLFHTVLGMRVLGLFRPILLALAFSLTGILAGLAFLLPVLALAALTRPLLRHASGYYPRVGVLLCLVAALLLVPVILGKWWHIEQLLAISSFPIIALCLSCESFARIASNNGLPEAIWRTVTSVAAALIILALTRIPGLMHLFFRFPELLLAQAGGILLINRHLALRLFKGKNPLRGRRAIRPAAELPVPNSALSTQNIEHSVGEKIS
jgi:hypothetical protein